MKVLRTVLGAVCALILACGFVPRATASPTPARIFLLMVWDGLRPDSVTPRDTPSLYALTREGVRFNRHHAVFPTVTMVNAAALATGAPPGQSGIYGDDVYWAPLLHFNGDPAAEPTLAKASRQVVMIENSKLLGVLNGANAFAGRELGLETIGQEVLREGGYLAVIGKRGPTFLFDNRIASVDEGRDSQGQAHQNYLFVSDDMSAPPCVADEVEPILSAIPAKEHPATRSDDYFARVVADKALPAAKQAAAAGKPALLIYWEHDPDITQHLSGLGTAPAIAALAGCDRNLGTVRAAIRALGIEDQTNLMVVSDHGFATIRMRVALAELLAGMGLKASADSDDIVVAANGGSDLVYLSRAKYPTEAAQRDVAEKIVNFVAAQEWCGPIFSREASLDPRKPYLGWIGGTFNQSAIGLMNSARSPDLVISFREFPDLDNSSLTGPGKRAFSLDAHGQESVRNNSSDLIRPVKGVLYSDAGPVFTTGLGMHGAAGARELHNFCAATGPAFRRGFADNSPTGNADVAPTISELLGLAPNTGPHATYPSGRVLSESLEDGRSAGAMRSSSMTSRLELQGMAVQSTLRFVRVGDHNYLDDASIEHIPLGRSP